MTADYTFLNERLAQHYGIPNVYGSHFRRVTLTDERRQGLLGKGAVLMVTSHTDRTSPVVRGKWVLDNLLGAPVPPMPTNVPPLNEDPNRGGRILTMRERMEEHRRNPVCAECHKIMDPIGLSMENFDAVGAWRTRDGDGVVNQGTPIDAPGQLLDGTKVDGVVTLRQALLRQPDLFVGTVTEKLMIYALGRGLQPYDMPSVRAIVRETAQNDYRFSSIVMGIVNSTPFQKRVTLDEPVRFATREPLMFISKMKLSRRTMLRGMGADAQPAAARGHGAGSDGGRRSRITRFGAIFTPLGQRPGYWEPKTVGKNFEFNAIMKPVEPFRDHLTVVTELCDPLDGHATTVSAWLSGPIPFRTIAENVKSGITIDQVIANKIGQDSPLPSLELATEDFTGWIGGCDTAYSCAYMNTISWKNETTPLPMEINPRIAFERLFGQPGTAAQRAARMRDNKSILDSVRDEARDLQKTLGGKDQARLERLSRQRPRDRSSASRRPRRTRRPSQTVPDAPIGIPDSFDEHASLMYDLAAVAFEANITRVFTFMKSRDASQRVYPNIGVNEPHHAMSHHGNNPDKIAGLVKLNTYYMSLFAKFLAKLKSTPDGDGSLLDHSMILYGSGMSESDQHSRINIPTLLAGGLCGTVEGNRHIQEKKETPFSNLLRVDRQQVRLRDRQVRHQHREGRDLVSCQG